jgi:molybdenum cofactor synthesis domain-containing protein
VITLAEAQARVRAHAAPLAPTTVAVRDALGCVLAEEARSPEDVPPFANTAMDGYAVRAGDVAGATEARPVVLPVVAEIAAGHPAPRGLAAGEAMRIFTGAPMPDGADAVVMVERAERRDEGEAVAVMTSVAPGMHVRGAGDDVRAGDVVFAAGEPLSSAHLGVLASIGRTEVTVHPRPRVGVLSTGDELVEGGAPLAPGQIRETNRTALVGALVESSFDAIDLGIVRDDEGAITDAIDAGVRRCDAVLTSGGVSMGDIDLVKVVLDQMTGGGMRWMQIAIKPAKPFAFGVVERDGRAVPVFGLPGNPVSSLVSFELLARPALRLMAGHRDADRVPVAATAADPLAREPDGKVHFVRVVVELRNGRYVARSAGAQGSHQLTGLARANGLAVLPDGDGAAAGEEVEVLLLGGVGRSAH